MILPVYFVSIISIFTAPGFGTPSILISSTGYPLFYATSISYAILIVVVAVRAFYRRFLHEVGPVEQVCFVNFWEKCTVFGFRCAKVWRPGILSLSLPH